MKKNGKKVLVKGYHLALAFIKQKYVCASGKNKITQFDRAHTFLYLVIIHAAFTNTV